MHRVHGALHNGNTFFGTRCSAPVYGPDILSPGPGPRLGPVLVISCPHIGPHPARNNFCSDGLVPVHVSMFCPCAGPGPMAWLFKYLYKKFKRKLFIWSKLDLMLTVLNTKNVNTLFKLVPVLVSVPDVIWFRSQSLVPIVNSDCSLLYFGFPPWSRSK